jgi:HEAT repeat-containing protein 5
MEPTIFEEFISLCYRMGMTEAAGIQIRLIEMLVDLVGLTFPALKALPNLPVASGSDNKGRLRVTQHLLSEWITIASELIMFWVVGCLCGTSHSSRFPGSSS